MPDQATDYVLREAAPLDPREARARLLVFLWLMAQLTASGGAIPDVTPRSQPGDTLHIPKRRTLRRPGPVRPPRSC